METYKGSPFHEKECMKVVKLFKREYDEIAEQEKMLNIYGIEVKRQEEIHNLSFKSDKKYMVLRYNIAMFRGNLLKKCDVFHKEEDRNGPLVSRLDDDPWFKQKPLLRQAREITEKFVAFKKINQGKDHIYCATFDNPTLSGDDDDDEEESTTLVDIWYHALGQGEKIKFPDPIPSDSLKFDKVEASSLSLSWQDRIVFNGNITKLKIKYCEDGGTEYKTKKTERIDKFFVTNSEVDKLHQDTTYYFKIQVVTPWGDLPMPDMCSEPVRTEKDNEMALAIRESGTVVRDSAWPNTIMVVPERKSGQFRVVNSTQGQPKMTAMVRKFEIGPTRVSIPGRDKVILMVGGSGHGKTTLMNSIANYLYGVKKEDEFRFRLVCEDEEGGSDQTESKTRAVTAYVLNGTRLRYNLTIVDTPGFGDTQGPERDKMTAQCIKAWFDQMHSGGTDRLDAICLVVKSTENRLSHQLKFVLNQVVTLFGKDMENNIVPLLTFCDASTPPAVTALKKDNIPFKKFFTLNNSAFFEGKNMNKFQSMFWDLGIESLEEFFTALESMKPCSLKLTQQVCSNRDRLEALVVSLEDKVKRGISQMETMDQQFDILQKHETDIKLNSKFEYEITKDVPIKTPITDNTYTTTCGTCEYTCHQKCKRPNDGDKEKCWAMKNGYCTMCPGKCKWDKHSNLPYLLTYEKKTVLQTDEDLKKLFGDATAKKQNHEEMLENMANKLMELEISISNDIKQIREGINQLNDIAMRPTDMTDIKYIELIIVNEKHSKEPGYKNRLSHYYQQLEMAKSIANAQTPNYDPLEQYRGKADGSGKKFVKYLAKRYPKWSKKLKSISSVKSFGNKALE